MKSNEVWKCCQQARKNALLTSFCRAKLPATLHKTHQTKARSPCKCRAGRKGTNNTTLSGLIEPATRQKHHSASCHKLLPEHIALAAQASGRTAATCQRTAAPSCFQQDGSWPLRFFCAGLVRVFLSRQSHTARGGGGEQGLMHQLAWSCSHDLH